MAANLQKRGLVSLALGKRLIMNHIARNSANSSTGRRAVHMSSVYDKNPEEYLSSVPNEIIEEAQSDKYWTPHPQTGVFGPATDHIIYDKHDFHLSTVDSVLEQKTFFRDLGDLEKPIYP
ncbi:putative cell division cycle 20.1, cofactor of APC complex-like isoform X1 [Capsicum annuum]|uniref:late embryogenesis abundant protein At5g17165 n=1 Tax=Capsicum annuum TaxID=4072 RepID=UPI0007BEBB7C|nr:late embryogenesis abundant protein At5g17165 [Capsicum annuum]KAF3639860.1 putative cell division cycle 20.1, cofactor of APC complex-like isoform X1 [Capsicum annuum]KAF3640490.1 putative cell division cycle 20.1, cofactor of APC complex-like isoform X1 [Capsicum annuum]